MIATISGVAGFIRTVAVAAVALGTVGLVPAEGMANETESAAIAASEKQPASEPPQEVHAYRLYAAGDLYISTDGSVSDYKIGENSKDLTADIAALVDKRVRSWRFEPILVDGKPVVAKTRMNLEIEAKPVAGGYQLRIAGVGFGNPSRMLADMKPPQYPSTARRAGVEADVLLVLTLGRDGRVVKTEVEQTSLSGGGPQRVVTQWADMFESSAKAASRHWRFTLTEEIAGQPATSTRVRVPVRYSIGSVQGWRSMVPVVRRGQEKPALPDMRVAAGSVASTGDQPQSLDSRFRLRDTVIGTAL